MDSKVALARRGDQSVQGIRNCLAHAPEGVELGMNITITKGNHEKLPEVAQLCWDLGLRWLNIQFLTPFGTPQGVTGSSMTTVNLGFNYTMPGGNVVTAVDVDAHGRIVEVGSDFSDSGETVAELLAQVPMIAACWDFMAYNADPNADLYFNTDSATAAWITWVNVSQAGVCTYQCQLHVDGSFVLVYDSRLPTDDGIIGVSPGAGAAAKQEESCRKKDRRSRWRRRKRLKLYTAREGCAV